jgi:hypothetical protein
MRVWTAWRCFENIFGALGIGAHFPSRASQRPHPVTYLWNHGSVLIYYLPVAYWHFTRFSLKIKCTYFHIFILSLWAQSNPRLRQTDKLGLKKRPYWIPYYIPYQEVIEYLLSVVPFWGINNWNRLCLYLGCLDISWNPTSLDNAILFTKSVASSLASIALCLFLRHLQDCGYSTKFRTRDLESGELPTKNSCERKGLGFGCIEKTSLQMQSWSMGERSCGWNLGRISITGIMCLLWLSHTWREQRGPQKTFSDWDTQDYYSFERRKEQKN